MRVVPGYLVGGVSEPLEVSESDLVTLEEFHLSGKPGFWEKVDLGTELERTEQGRR